MQDFSCDRGSGLLHANVCMYNVQIEKQQVCRLQAISTSTATACSRCSRVVQTHSSAHAAVRFFFFHHMQKKKKKLVVPKKKMNGKKKENNRALAPNQGWNERGRCTPGSSNKIGQAKQSTMSARSPPSVGRSPLGKAKTPPSSKGICPYCCCWCYTKRGKTCCCIDCCIVCTAYTQANSYCCPLNDSLTHLCRLVDLY